MKKAFFYRISIFFNLIGLIAIITLAYQNREFFFNQFFKIKRCNIVMYGDSMIHKKDWAFSLKRFDVKSSGSNGFTSSHFVWRIQDDVIKYKPKICFLDFGINDIGTGIPLQRTINNYSRIVDTLLVHNIRPVINTVLYLNNSDSEYHKVRCDSLNNMLFKLAYDKHLQIINMNPKVSENGLLKAMFTVDGIHLNHEGYKLWLKEISKVLDAENI